VKYRFAKLVNNYGVSDDSAIYLIENSNNFEVGLSREGSVKIAWDGFDQFGVRLECVAIVFIDFFYIMHLKPIDPKEDLHEIKKRLW
jgi:orotate phosphoribosyltransferase-like protein